MLEFFSGERRPRGSARVSRAGFGVSPKQSFKKFTLARRQRQQARRVRYGRDARVSSRDTFATLQPVVPRYIRARAFSLLEIMLAVIILGMMSLAIYRFVQANVTAMRVSSEGDAVEARYDGLRELLTQQLQSLPPGTGALTGEPLKIEGHDRDELSWVCPAGPGLLTRYATGDFQVSLRLRPH